MCVIISLFCFCVEDSKVNSNVCGIVCIWRDVSCSVCFLAQDESVSDSNVPAPSTESAPASVASAVDWGTPLIVPVGENITVTVAAPQEEEEDDPGPPPASVSVTTPGAPSEEVQLPPGLSTATASASGSASGSGSQPGLSATDLSATALLTAIANGARRTSTAAVQTSDDDKPAETQASTSSAKASTSSAKAPAAKTETEPGCCGPQAPVCGTSTGSCSHDSLLLSRSVDKPCCVTLCMNKLGLLQSFLHAMFPRMASSGGISDFLRVLRTLLTCDQPSLRCGDENSQPAQSPEGLIQVLATAAGHQPPPPSTESIEDWLGGGSS